MQRFCPQFCFPRFPDILSLRALTSYSVSSLPLTPPTQHLVTLRASPRHLSLVWQPASCRPLKTGLGPDHEIKFFMFLCSDYKGSTCNVGEPGLIPESERFPGEGNGNPLQCSCLENPMDRGAWLATDHGIAKGQTRPRD